jgi:hypothetical protein
MPPLASSVRSYLVPGFERYQYLARTQRNPLCCEFRRVITHEFADFSQRSAKAEGSPEFTSGMLHSLDERIPIRYLRFMSSTAWGFLRSEARKNRPSTQHMNLSYV